MDDGSWLGVTAQHTLQFFFEQLGDIVDDAAHPNAERLYNASVLAHYATTSTSVASHGLPAPSSLADVFDLFVLDRSQHTDPELMEAAATQCLLLTGFFARQQAHRHNLRWYAALGAGFFASAGQHHRERARARMMWAMAEHFEFWRDAQMRLAAHLRDEPMPLTHRRIA